MKRRNSDSDLRHRHRKFVMCHVCIQWTTPEHVGECVSTQVRRGACSACGRRLFNLHGGLCVSCEMRAANAADAADGQAGITRLNGDDTIRHLERKARDGDVEALSRWQAAAIRMNDRATVRLIDDIAREIAGYPVLKSDYEKIPASLLDSLQQIWRTSAEFRHDLPRGSLRQYRGNRPRRRNSDATLRAAERAFSAGTIAAEELAAQYLRSGMDREHATTALRTQGVGLMDSHEAVADVMGVPLVEWKLINYDMTFTNDGMWDMNGKHYTGDVVRLPVDPTSDEVLEVMEDEGWLRPPGAIEVDWEAGSPSTFVFRRKSDHRPMGEIQRDHTS